MRLRFYIDPDTKQPHIYNHNAAEKEAKEVNSQFPPGWNEERVRQVLAHYEQQTEEEAVAENEAAFEQEMRKTVEFVEVANSKLWTIRQGRGTPLLLCHGGPGGFYDIEVVADMIDDLVTVYGYDQRACGMSTGNPPFTVDSFVSDMEALRQHWQISKWIVAGVSFGAELARAYCISHGECALALVYESGAGLISENPAKWREEYVANYRNRFSDEEWQRISELKKKRNNATGFERSLPFDIKDSCH